MVVEADMRVGVGGRGVVWFTSTAVIVAIEQDGVLKCIALGGQWGDDHEGVCVCEGMCVHVLYYTSCVHVVLVLIN